MYEVDGAEAVEDRNEPDLLQVKHLAKELKTLAQESSDYPPSTPPLSRASDIKFPPKIPGRKLPLASPTHEFATNTTSISSTAKAMQEFSRKKTSATFK